MPRVERTVRAAKLHERAIELRAAGRTVAAMKALRASAQLFAAAGGERDVNAVHARVELAEILELRGELASAVAIFEEGARSLRRVASRKDTPDDVKGLFLRARLGGARVRQLRGELGRAERVYREALVWARAQFGRKSPVVAAVMTAQGILRKAQGRYAEALALYRRALPIVRAQRGNAADLAALYHNLAGSEHARGRLKIAEGYARKGLSIRRRAFGAEDHGTIADEAALAPILDGLGKRAEAERLYLRALKYFRRWYGPRSYEVAVNLGNLGVLQRNAGHLHAAARNFREAIAIEETLLGKWHPELALSLNNLAVVLAALGDRRSAVQSYRRALSILTATVGQAHPRHRAAARNLARLI